MTIEEQIERLAGIVTALGTTVVSHDNQIEGLKLAEQQSAEIAATERAIAAIERQWQAYINTLPRH
jgi:hypothetical protein